MYDTSLTSVLISRFILDLRDEYINGTIQRSIATVNPQSIAFAHFASSTMMSDAIPPPVYVFFALLLCTYTYMNNKVSRGLAF